MSPRWVGAPEIARCLTWPALIEHLRQAHRAEPALAQRLSMSHRPAPGVAEQALLLLPAWRPGQALGVKLVSSFPDNRHAPAVQALYVLFDGRDGAPRLLLDGTALTYWKTAADSALAADYLARRDAATLLMVGAGALAPYLAQAYRAVRPSLQRIRLWNRTPSRCAALAAQLGAAGLAHLDIATVDDLQAAVAQADVVCCATGARQPLVRGAWLREGAHLDLVGGFTPDMREADDDAVRRARAFVDCRTSTIAVVGDLTQPIAAGVLRPEDIEGDLFDLCSGRVGGRGSRQENTWFKSGGGAHLDLMTAQFVAERLDGAPATP